MPTAKKIGEDVETIDGILGEVVYKSGKKVMKSTTADKAHWFSQLKRYELDRGYKKAGQLTSSERNSDSGRTITDMFLSRLQYQP
jgi:hypothetical protein